MASEPYKVTIQTKIVATSADKAIFNMEADVQLVVTAETPDQVHAIVQHHHKLANELESKYPPFAQGTATG